MTLEAVLFDLDGTLLDTAADFRTALNRLLQEEGRPTLEDQDVRVMVSNGSANLVAQAFAIDNSHAEFEPLRLRLLEHYADCMLDNTRPYAGMEESLEFIQSRGKAWGIVTNKPQYFTDAIIAGLGMNPATLICPEHTGKPKPDPAGIVLGCAELNCAPENCLYIGDHKRDIDAGKGAGCKTMAAAYGYIEANDDATTWGADWLLMQSTDLPQLLAEHLT